MSRALTERRAYAGMAPAEALAAHEAHRDILKVLTGLLLAMFVGNMSATIVGNALPVIVGEIGGTQQQYTWIVTSTILASTAVTPIAGKLADLYDKKRLLLASMVVFLAGSVLAGLSTSAGMLIAVRVVQGVGMGANMVLTQIIIASLIPPRQRGRYNGYLGAVIAAATVSGPLVGGIIVDTPWLGWRWTFWVAVPFVLIALAVLTRSLHVPGGGRPGARVDWLGAALISLSATLVLLWVSFADHEFDWISWQTGALLGAALLTAVAFVLVERRAPEPVVPLSILTARTTALAVVASLAVGTVMFGSNVFLGQYFQIGRGYSPTVAGWLGLPLMLGLLVSSTVAGNLVTRTGRWRPAVVGGVGLLTVGIGLMATVGSTTPVPLVALYLLVAGVGLGASMQNLVLAVQNTVELGDVGAATAVVTFFRTLGGAVGIQVLGAVYAQRVTALTLDGAADAGVDAAGTDAATASLDLGALPAAMADLVRGAYGDAIGSVFAVAGLVSLLAFVATLLMRGSTLRSTWATAGPSAAAERRTVSDPLPPGRP
ncbi:MFS transporter [Georgenia muralis]|uniref:EmrB/QacA subfamily drug resistance transporter n=1 Tax=Georgenia muralis TaxID=154117 RepID=A0A3N4Z7E6_9MICO|nr:MFS transporter [Georgenia muralis]RPF27100.1 EmrB/QacA subfamily drug resistance transporter [Georgenia muralis]